MPDNFVPFDFETMGTAIEVPDAKYNNELPEPELAEQRAKEVANAILRASVLPLCKGKGELFYPRPKDIPYVEEDPEDTRDNVQYLRISDEQLLIAQSYCANCALREPCDARATADDQAYGIWAGIDRKAKPDKQAGQRADMEVFVENPGLLREAVEGLEG